MTQRQLAVFCFIAAVWGSSFLFIKVLVDAGVEPLGVSGARTAIGFAALAPFAWKARRRFPRGRRMWAGLCALGLVNFAIPWTLFGIGAQHSPSGVGSITNAAQPLWAAVFAALLLPAERLRRAQVAGLLFGFLGVIILMGNRVSHFDRDALLGVPVMVLATLCYGASAVAIRRWLGHVSAIPLTVAQIGVAAVLLLPTAFATGAYEGARFGWEEWLSLLLLGAVGSAVAVVFYMSLIAQVGPVRAGAVTYLMPPVGVFLGWLLLDEGLRWPMLAGVALILLGVAVVQGRLRSGRRSPIVSPPPSSPTRNEFPASGGQ